MASASTPAAGPSPSARTNSSAHTISGMARNTISSQRAACRTMPACTRPGPGPMREMDSARVVTKPSGAPISSAMAVPAVAMARVSSVALASSARKAGELSGGKKPARKPPMTARLPLPNSAQGLNSESASTGHATASAASQPARRRPA
ncbi:hypothetical protein D9M68_380040 [compost metagenome]